MAKQTKKFVYQTRDSSTVKARASQRSGDFDSIFKEGIKIFKPRDGKNKVRIIPPTWVDANHYGFEIFVNYGIGIDNQQYLSLSSMKNEPDPLAEARKQAERQGDKKLADALKPTKRVIFYVIDRMAEDEGVQLWPAPWSVDKSFANLAIDEDSGSVTVIDHPDEGHDLTFYKEGTGLATKYPAEKMRISKEPCPLHEDEQLADEWLRQAQELPLPDALNFYDYDHINEVFDGQVRNDKEPQKPRSRFDEEDDEPVKKPSSRTTMPKVTSHDEDEEDDEPVRKPNGKPAVRTQNNEDEEATLSATSIRSRLASRKARATVNGDDD